MRPVVAALAAVVAFATSAASPLTTQDLMTMLAAVEASRAKFTETRHSTLLKQPLVTSGSLVYRRPDRLEKHVLAPFKETVTIEGTRVDIVREGQAGRSIAMPAGGPARALLEGLRATLAGDLATLSRHFTADVAGLREEWTLTLTPRDPSLAATVARVEFTGQGERVRRIEVLEAGGDRVVTTIEDERR